MSGITNPTAGGSSSGGDSIVDTIILDSENKDVGLARSAAGVLTVTDGSDGKGQLSVPGAGADSEAFGLGASAQGSSVSIGRSSNAASTNSVAIGRSAIARQNGLAIGYSAETTNANSVTIGFNSTAYYYSVAIGHEARAAADETSFRGYSVAVGQSAEAGQRSVAIGHNVECTSAYSVAIGKDAKSTNANGSSVSIGADSQAGRFSIAIGRGSQANGNNECTFGSTTSYINTFSIVGSAGTTTISQGVLGLVVYTVATAPDATTAGQVAYFSDGAAGSPVLAFSNGTNWLRCDTLAAISSS